MRLLLISSSTVHGYGFLDHPEPEIRALLEGLRRVAFVPFALKDRSAYTAKVRERLGRMGFDVVQVESAADLLDADAIFVGGGNTFRLLNLLYERNLIDEIRQRVRSGIPYIGSSAGTNVAAPTIRTTNDMPIVQPPSFDAFGFVPFQINPHYLDPDPHSTHKGETREERIREFLEENDTPVIGLREGTMLRVGGGRVTLLGMARARIFRRGAEPVEVDPGSAIEL
ncbi:MAG TPA: dipeptidase PepE [Thermoanaerobaculia bacterium]|nr:dipeptidase PepE [Thermoanaerobaculia bacterium]